MSTDIAAGVLQYFPTEYNTQKSQHEKQNKKTFYRAIDNHLFRGY